MTPPLRAVIVEDEPLCVEALSVPLERHGSLQVAYTCNNGADALRYLGRNSCDVLFLDIELPDMTGLDILTALTAEQRPQYILFVTAYDEFAVDAFQKQAIDYLVKPFSEARLEQALQRILDDRELRDSARALDALQNVYAERQQPVERIMVRKDNRYIVVPTEDILAVVGADYYVRIQTDTAEYLHKKTLKSMEALLGTERFMRIHRSALIRIDAVRELRIDENGEYVAQLSNGQDYAVSRKTKHDLLERLGKL